MYICIFCVISTSTTHPPHIFKFIIMARVNRRTPQKNSGQRFDVHWPIHTHKRTVQYIHWPLYTIIHIHTHNKYHQQKVQLDNDIHCKNYKIKDDHWSVVWTDTDYKVNIATKDFFSLYYASFKIYYKVHISSPDQEKNIQW